MPNTVRYDGKRSEAAITAREVVATIPERAQAYLGDTERLAKFLEVIYRGALQQNRTCLRLYAEMCGAVRVDVVQVFVAQLGVPLDVAREAVREWQSVSGMGRDAAAEASVVWLTEYVLEHRGRLSGETWRRLLQALIASLPSAGDTMANEAGG
jgi:hypothetical protein